MSTLEETSKARLEECNSSMGACNVREQQASPTPPDIVESVHIEPRIMILELVTNNQNREQVIAELDEQLQYYDSEWNEVKHYNRDGKDNAYAVVELNMLFGVFEEGSEVDNLVRFPFHQEKTLCHSKFYISQKNSFLKGELCPEKFADISRCRIRTMLEVEGMELTDQAVRKVYNNFPHQCQKCKTLIINHKRTKGLCNQCIERRCVECKVYKKGQDFTVEGALSYDHFNVCKDCVEKKLSERFEKSKLLGLNDDDNDDKTHLAKIKIATLYDIGMDIEFLQLYWGRTTAKRLDVNIWDMFCDCELYSIMFNEEEETALNDLRKERTKQHAKEIGICTDVAGLCAEYL